MSAAENLHTAHTAHAQLDAANVRAYVTAGHAVVTLVSRATGARYTYRVDKGNRGHLVSLLTGPDCYSYVGLATAEGGFYPRRGGVIPVGSPSLLAWAWFWARLDRLPSSIEVWHEGQCGRCGRALTDPASIAVGLGPVCRERM